MGPARRRYTVVSVNSDAKGACTIIVEADSTIGALLHSEEGAIRLEPILSE